MFICSTGKGNSVCAGMIISIIVCLYVVQVKGNSVCAGMNISIIVCLYIVQVKVTPSVLV